MPVWSPGLGSGGRPRASHDMMSLPQPRRVGGGGNDKGRRRAREMASPNTRPVCYRRPLPRALTGLERRDGYTLQMTFQLTLAALKLHDMQCRLVAPEVAWEEAPAHKNIRMHTHTHTRAAPTHTDWSMTSTRPSAVKQLAEIRKNIRVDAHQLSSNSLGRPTHQAISEPVAPVRCNTAFCKCIP